MTLTPTPTRTLTLAPIPSLSPSPSLTLTQVDIAGGLLFDAELVPRITAVSPRLGSLAGGELQRDMTG